jgi:hypothetical protein
MCCPKLKYSTYISSTLGKTIYKTLVEVVINKYFPWDFFDGASQGTPPGGGARGILHLSQSHSVSFKEGNKSRKNNYCELMTLKLY